MKKSLRKILLLIFTLTMVFTGLIACSNPSGWDPSKVTLTNGGAVLENGGFIAETENYVYFINGVEDSTSDNTFGAPVRGALVVADKDDLSNSCIVVPKLFVASDYDAGVFISNGYVYYGTPCTDLDSSGAVAKSQMTFARTKLDGTGTENYFTISSLSAEYRFVEDQDGNVNIVYYDSTDKALYSFSTQSKQKTTIAKTNEKANEETLNAYFFLNGDGPVVMYTVSVYDGEYNERETSRNKKSFNRAYVYTLGDVKQDETAECLGEKVFDGEGVVNKTLSISFVNGSCVCYSVANVVDGISKTYYVDLTNGFNPVQVVNVNYAKAENLIVGVDEVYAMEDKYIVKASLTGDVSALKETVARVETVNSLLFKDGDFIYYRNSSNNLYRVYVGDRTGKQEKDLMEQKVSENVVSSMWYMPEIIDGKIFYLDNSKNGCSYVKYVSVSAEVKTDVDEDGEITACYLDGQEFVGILLDSDKAVIAENIIKEKLESCIENGQLVFDEDDDGNIILTNGEPNIEAIVEARAIYDGLTTEKGLVTASTVKMLKNYEEALRINKLLYKLYEFDTAVDKDAFETAFNTAKQAIDALANSREFSASEIRGYFSENYNYYYQEAYKYFVD